MSVMQFVIEKNENVSHECNFRKRKVEQYFFTFFSQKVIKSVNKMSVIIYSTLKTKQTEYRANFYTNSRKISAYYTVRVSAKMRTVFTMLFLNLILVIKRT